MENPHVSSIPVTVSSSNPILLKLKLRIFIQHTEKLLNQTPVTTFFFETLDGCGGVHEIPFQEMRLHRMYNTGDTYPCLITLQRHMKCNFYHRKPARMLFFSMSTRMGGVLF